MTPIRPQPSTVGLKMPGIRVSRLRGHNFLHAPKGWKGDKFEGDDQGRHVLDVSQVVCMLMHRGNPLSHRDSGRTVLENAIGAVSCSGTGTGLQVMRLKCQ